MNAWHGLMPRARIGLVAGALAIGLFTAAAGWWLLRTEYQALFTELKPQDAQAMTTELDRLKIPYRLGDAGTAILVDKSTVHETRIKLMGKELPLQGAVGLELFNHTDFGMTEFAQKINYQRALQGELTRTIQSLAQVREVRVLLALPEQGLFKPAASKAKASITLGMRQGQALRAEQVAGVQRLVAAAVPGMAMQDVTIVDSHGVALTRPEAGNGEPEPNGARLDLKRDTEAYLARKVTEVLASQFGPGQAIASVDVTLNMDQIRTTTEDVLPAASRSGLQSAGVMVREREVLRDAGSAPDARLVDGGGARSGSAQREVDYAVGRRVEQVVSQPGSIRRVQVVAVVRKALDAPQEEQLRKVVAASVGASLERGDTVVVQSLAGAVPLSDKPGAASAPEAAAPGDDLAGEPLDAAEAPGAVEPNLKGALLSLLAGLALALLIGLFVAARRPRAPPPRPQPGGAPLSGAEREAALQRVRDWMDAGKPTR